MSIYIGYCPVQTVYFVLLVLLTAVSNGQYFKECHTKTFVNPNHLFEHCRRITQTSKYAAMPDPKHINYEESVAWCEERDMNLAVITSLSDYKSLHEYFNWFNPNCAKNTETIWHFWNTDKESEGTWLNGDGTKMTFQAFHTFEPLNSASDSKKKGDYLILQCSKTPPGLDIRGPASDYTYRDVELGFNRYLQSFFCEFKKESPCWINSLETQKNNELEDELKLLGETDWGKYYIGTVQKTWKDAFDFCSSNQMKMLDMEFTTSSEAEAAYKFLGKFIDDNNLLALSTSFFLSGSFSKMFTGEDVPFEWEWIDDIYRTKADPSNKLLCHANSQSRFGNCLSVGSLYKSKCRFTLSAAICTLPHWFVCVEAKD